mgnify:CR=1 FL=1
MLTVKNKLFTLLILSFLVFTIGCDMQQQAGQEGETPLGEETSALVDTADAQPQVAIAPDSVELEKSRSEIEQRLENLLALIEQKEKALLYRENELKDAQAELALRQDELEKKAQQIKSQRNVSWIVLIIGALALIVAFIIVARNRGRGAADEKVNRQKQKTLDKLDAQMTKWEAEINSLRDKANKAKDDVKEEYLKQIDALNKQKEQAQKKYDELKNAGAETWDELKKSVDSAWAELKESIHKAREKIKS